MHNTVHKRRNVRTHSQMGLWARCGKACIFIVPQQSLWLLGTRAAVKEHNDPSSVLSAPPLLGSAYITLRLPLPFPPPLCSPCSSCHSLPFYPASMSPLLFPSPLPFLPVLLRLQITFCLSVAEHSTSRLSLNIDRKVNGNTTQVIHAALSIYIKLSFSLCPTHALTTVPGSWARPAALAENKVRLWSMSKNTRVSKWHQSLNVSWNRVVCYSGQLLTLCSSLVSVCECMHQCACMCMC